MSNLRQRSTFFVPLFSILLWGGCSAHQTEQQMTSTTTTNDTHLYNSEYGLVSDPQTDAIIHQEILAQNSPTEVVYELDDPNYTTELKRDPDAFLAEEWVQPAPKITYKYDDDPKFYTEEELPENKLKLGDVVVKIPQGADQATLLEGIERASTPQSGY